MALPFLTELYIYPANVIVPLILFLIFTPGMLFVAPVQTQDPRMIMLVHAAMFIAAYAALRYFFPAFYHI